MSKPLLDFDPHWVGILRWSSPDPFYIGITFLCPHCGKTRLYCPFKNPIDPHGYIGRVFNWPDTPGGWLRVGETFETITLSPSVDSTAHGHWHGFIEGGAIR